MKKYLIIGAAALSLGGVFTSCTKDTDLYDPMSDSQKFLQTYAEVFYKVFGQPAANQTWGFGDATRATRAIQPTYQFPEDADKSKFLADVPEGVEKLANNVGNANNWIDETWTDALNIWGAGTEANGWVAEGGTLYIKGNCDFSSRNFYFAGNSELYLLEGATLTLKDGDKGAGGLQQNTKIYIAEGAKLVAKGELKLNNGLQIFNHGTIEAPILSTNSNSVLYNVGEVKVDGKFSVKNELSVVVNDGTIEAGSVQTEGSGKVQNNGDFTVVGNTTVDSNENTWVNNGTYFTDSFTYHASSREVINNCRLIVDKTFAITLGDSEGAFRMDTNASVEAGSLEAHGPFYIEMGANSLFQVTGTAILDARKANYGIVGPTTGGYAVFAANKIEKGKDNQGYEVTYHNNLYIYSETTHFENGLSGAYPYIDFKGGCSEANIYATNFTAGMPPYTIEESECCNGFYGGDEDPYQGRIMAEDLNATEESDFDFNDVVFDWKIVDGVATIQLRAAGGRLPLVVGGQKNSDGLYIEGTGVEVHEAFGLTGVSDVVANYDTNKQFLINTGVNFLPEPEPFTLNDKTYTEAADIFVFVKKDGVWCELTAERGKAAAKINVKTTTKWVDEYVDITRAYPGFATWVKNPEVDWQSNVVGRFVDLDLSNNN